MTRTSEENVPHLEAKIRALEEELAERERTEASLRAREARWREIIESHPQGFAIVSPEGRLLDINPAALSLIEATTAHELTGRPLTDFVHPEDRETFLGVHQRAVSGEAGQGHFRLLCGGEAAPRVAAHATPLPEAGGVISSVLYTFRALNGERATNDRQEKSATLLRMAGNIARFGGWTIELPERRLTWSDETCAIHDAQPGYQPTLAEGLELFPPEYRAEVVRHLENCIQKGISYEFELPKYTVKGRRIWVRSIGEAVRDAEGNIVCLQGAFQDITERKKTEQQFFQAQRMETIGTLAGGIAHDLNNVLAPILLAVELTRLSEQEDERLHLLTQIEKSARHGANLVKQVLAFARGVKGHHVAVNLLHLTHDLQRIIKDTFPKNIDFQIEHTPDLWTLKADATQLYQVLMNLCVNSRDAMAPDGGRLTLGLKNAVLDETSAAGNPDAKPGNYVAIRVEDTGTGISDEIRERIFDPFFTTREPGKGTGLGLSTVMSIVKGHGGFIEVESEPERGTIVLAYLPATAEPVQAIDVPQTKPVEGEGELILVVDDEESIRTITRKLLERRGYRVLLAVNGAEAVSLYTEHGQDIAVVLTDMAMPVMDGVATISALRSLNPAVKIIGSSGNAGQEMRLQKDGPALEHFLRKPYTSDRLLNVLAQVLAKP